MGLSSAKTFRGPKPIVLEASPVSERENIIRNFSPHHMKRDLVFYKSHEGNNSEIQCPPQDFCKSCYR